MQKKIVYVLGAGFSAPLGIPTMDQFIGRAKEIFFRKTDELDYFKDVIDDAEVSKILLYFNAPLRNIEHMLSVLEMKDILTSSNKKEIFIKFIKDVIVNSTPELKTKSPSGVNWYDLLFSGGPDRIWNYYGSFVLNLLGLVICVDNARIVHDGKGNALNPMKRFVVKKLDEQNSQYSIITLNYDKVIENICGFVNELETNGLTIGFRRFDNNAMCGEKIENEQNPLLIKLHGSIDDDIFVLPTWNKSLGTDSSGNAWKVAINELMKCNSLRIIGYSLSETDYYVRYLFEAAASLRGLEHLESIDILCLDDEINTIRDRYRNFISSHQKMRFINANVEDYLKTIWESKKSYNYNDPISYNFLENAHEKYFNRL